MSNITPLTRSEFAYTRVGEILVIFGGSSNGVLLWDLYITNLSNQESSLVEPSSGLTPSGRKGACMAGAGGYLFIFGGITVEGYSNELWMFNLASNNYELLKSQGNTP
jgi:hypothetical protein